MGKRHEALKAHEDRLYQLMRELKENREIVREMVQRDRWLEREIKAVKSHIANLVPRAIEVTDHAVLRYAERRAGLNLNQIREEIARLVAGCEDMGEVKINGFVVKNNTVVTYIPQEDKC
jgi:hemerythrin-like domain-containing protein